MPRSSFLLGCDILDWREKLSVLNSVKVSELLRAVFCRQRRHLPHLLRPLLLLLYWNKRKKTDTMTFSSLIWSWFVLGLMCRLWCFQWSMVYHSISVECANLVLFGRQRQSRLKRLLLLRHQMWQHLTTFSFGSSECQANLIASTYESISDWLVCWRGQPGQPHSSNLGLDWRFLQLFHAGNWSRSRCSRGRSFML